MLTYAPLLQGATAVATTSVATALATAFSPQCYSLLQGATRLLCSTRLGYCEGECYTATVYIHIYCSM